ncbi:MAG: helix-turn-helix transcriptional regulator, partial [Lachnospiraceae bacterium]|nr:helix-turn-helix transcriptional regulator [Lachnospiraceae bacterium]
YQNNMSYRELSRLSGISLSSLNDIANFKKEPKQSTMISIARALNMEVSEIFDLNWRK